MLSRFRNASGLRIAGWVLSLSLLACGSNQAPVSSQDSDAVEDPGLLSDGAGRDAPEDSGAEDDTRSDLLAPDATGGTPACADRALVDDVPGGVPTEREWLAHLADELMPYWTMPAALGSPQGDFPTFRCDDGSVYDSVSNACPELRDADDWIRDELGRQYVRMMSRQTYLYGVAYHLTGDEGYFRLHRAGAATLRTRALDPSGGAYTYFAADGTPGPAPGERNSQDLAYALLGLAMNYYLTRDPAVLDEVLALKDVIFASYWDETLGMIRWTPSNSGGEQELVAQLDQLNAYMVLLWRVLPEHEQVEWGAHMSDLVDTLVNDYYSTEHNLFWGAVHSADRMQVGSFHTDFGHTIKAFWMIYTIARLTGDVEREAWARDRALRVLADAYITDPGDYVGAWAEKLSGRDSPRVWPGTEWWSYIELNQMAATMSLVEGDALAYLDTTYPVFFERMVDETHGGVFHFVADAGTVRFAKAHLWKNGYHELEHVLVGYLTGQAMRGERATLYFAFDDEAINDTVVPYYYEGTVVGATSQAFTDISGFSRTRVTFCDVR